MALNFVTYNQDYSHLAVGTSNGFRIYYTDPFSKAFETTEGDITLLEMLFSTSLVATVLSPRRLVITNTKRNSTICELTFPQTILNVRLNRKRLVVVLEDQIYLYDISNMKLVQTIDTSPNPQGICALSPSSDRCYLAYPMPQQAAASSFAPPSHVPPTSPHLSVTSGHVMIFDALPVQAVNLIEAHRAPLSCIAIDSSGSKLATASDKGTVIRVFSIPDAQKLAQFRRGTLPARIFSMAFNSTSTLLCVSSATETVHVFKLSPSQPKHASSSPTEYPTVATSPRSRRPSNRSSSPASSDMTEDFNVKNGRSTSPMSDAPCASNGTFTGLLRRTSHNVSKSFAATVGGYLPSAVSEMLEPARDFAWFKIPRSSPGPGISAKGGGAEGGGALKSVVAMSSSSPQVMVVTSEGSFLVFNIDLEEGGEGTLTKQCSILDSNEQGTRRMSSIGEDKSL